MTVPAGEVINGWRVVNKTVRRRRWGFLWVEEPRIELIKGHRNIDAYGQDGIDPETVYLRAMCAALADDVRQLIDDGKLDEAIATRLALDEWEIRRSLHEAADAGIAIARKLGGAIFWAPTARLTGKAETDQWQPKF